MNLMNVLLMTSPNGDGSGQWSSMIMILAMIAIFYFFMIRPQTKRAKQEREFREKIEKGQKVVTISGVHGKIVEVKETTFMLEVANGVQIEVEKTAVAVDLKAQGK